MSLRIEQTRDIATCQRLRAEVFTGEQGVSEADEVDGRDGDALHLLLWEGDCAQGTARMLILDDTAKIGRVCILAEARGRGLGAALMRAALTLARNQPGVTRARLGAQLSALTFYEALGFTAEGPVYDDAGIDHRDMVRDL
ncbi:GNAT family N-acetyltransferase [uncultured Roseobacter sp.]|uniref:GNAT family N-acetyltransferase n=1 Tax=uncultured Roseobacter sp. TaxID=114847 RepID=UPI002619F2E5|nr:GNAT family N-acetyltransferase [uncultured Roseobacter sp.]